jgi:hypothetical protein
MTVRARRAKWGNALTPDVLHTFFTDTHTHTHTRKRCPLLRLACLSDVVSQPVTLRPSLGVPEYRAARAGWRLDAASAAKCLLALVL